jgi:hypothetical protein
MQMGSKGVGAAAVIASIAVPLSTALGAFEGRPSSVVIAGIALMAVALAVAGHVVVADLWIRGEQTIASTRLAQGDHGNERPPAHLNGHARRGSQPGPPSRVLLKPRSGDVEIEILEQW